MNKKGFNLVELMVCIAISGILSMAMCASFRLANVKIAQLQSLSGQPFVRLVALTNSCQLIDGIYYGKASDANTLSLYTNAACTAAFGTLNRLDNSTWFNETTKSQWLLYSSNTVLKVAIISYK